MTVPNGWTPVRKDFVDPATTRCHARSPLGGRHHGFPEGHAYILRDAEGHEYPFGADCARAVLPEPSLLETVPDYTERDVPPAAASLPRMDKDAARKLARRNTATRYVVLRMEKVAAVPRVQPTVRFPALEDLYRQIARGEPLSDAQVTRVLGIERSASTPPRLKAENLLDVYTAHTKLERLIAESNNVENIRFLRGVHDWLARHLVLSAAQIAAAGIVMHPHAFRSGIGERS
ncbi:hypothetical protein [Cupriavidus plantarum]|uniref:Uncharacterized protein n=1 Tax=Cupriavidus plantarum TaxID=942865 RepID=A0A316F219_9BURK|nr:hypothetical protein [Cupriavidus plantarum]PWK37573.1 hypothetical protein C7419_1011455 [Cupriavidus plantarum]